MNLECSKWDPYVLENTKTQFLPIFFQLTSIFRILNTKNENFGSWKSKVQGIQEFYKFTMLTVPNKGSSFRRIIIFTTTASMT